MITEYESQTHIYFYGGLFSNFSTCHNGCAIRIAGDMIAFKTSEHAFMASKAVEFNDLKALQRIINADYAGYAKKIGRQVKGFDPVHWDSVRYERMRQCLLAKYSQNELHQQALLASGDKILVEASPTDRIWGVGLGLNNRDLYDESKWKGKNLLGKCLMEVREQLKGDA